MPFDEEQMIQDAFEYPPAALRSWEIESLQPTTTPLSPDWGATIYYDPEIFPNPVSFERVERHYANAYPGRHFSQRSLRKDGLQHFAIAKYPRVEELFRRRGFVSDIEVTSFERKDHHPETTYLATNKAAAGFQFTLIAYIKSDPALPIVEAVEESADLARMIDGHRVRRNLSWRPAPLVERDGVFYVDESLQERECVHFALRWKPLLALENGMRDPFSLCHAMPEDVAAQVRFEFANSAVIFAGASADALLLWQQQVLAILRKVVWGIEIATNASFDKQEIAEDKARKRSLKRLLADSRAVTAEPVQKALSAVVNDRKDAYREAMIEENALSRIYGQALGSEEYHHGITTEQNVIATLHGSTYEPDFDWDYSGDRSDPLHWLTPLAQWIGQLKRHRHAVLNEQIGACIMAIFGDYDVDAGYDERLQSFGSVIENRLGDVAWTAIADVVPAILDGSRAPVSVVYDWTQDADQPWAAERREDGTIVIRGPLLDFPVSRVEFWNEKSAGVPR